MPMTDNDQINQWIKIVYGREKKKNRVIINSLLKPLITRTIILVSVIIKVIAL